MRSIATFFTSVRALACVATAGAVLLVGCSSSSSPASSTPGGSNQPGGGNTGGGGSGDDGCAAACANVDKASCPNQTAGMCSSDCSDEKSKVPAACQSDLSAFNGCVAGAAISCDSNDGLATWGDACDSEYSTLTDCIKNPPSGGDTGGGNTGGGTLAKLGDACKCDGPDGTLICQSTNGPCEADLSCLNNHGVCASSCDNGSGAADPSKCSAPFYCTNTEVGFFCLTQ